MVFVVSTCLCLDFRVRRQLLLILSKKPPIIGSYLKIEHELFFSAVQRETLAQEGNFENKIRKFHKKWPILAKQI